MLLLEIVAVVLLADFVSGLVHWWEDAYARVGDGPLGRVARDNLRHHARPREFLAKGYWASSWDLWLLGTVAVSVCAALGVLSWHVLLFALLVANANQIHKWAHMQAAELPRPVAWLHRTQILQTTRHHSRHHQGQRNTHYCVITNFLNPVLEEAQWWTRIERAIERLTGIRRRDDERELAAMGLATRRVTRHDAHDELSNDARDETHRPDFAVRLLRVMPSGVRWLPATAAR